MPPHLRDAHYHGSEELGVVGYKYAHDYPEHYVRQQYLPDDLLDEHFYISGNNGYEKQINEWMKHLKELNDEKE